MEQHDVERAIDSLLSAPKHSIDLGDFAQAIVGVFGGPEAMAREARELYESMESKQQRTQMFRLLLGIVKDHAAITKGEQAREASMSTEEIKQEIRALMHGVLEPQA